MKRYFVLTIMYLCFIPIMAQHMNFLGKPLGCSINTFKQRMVERGYKSNGEVEPTAYSFDGVFGGDRVLVAAYVTPKSNIVYSVGVFYLDYTSKSYDESSLNSQMDKFESLISSFTKKYGDISRKGNKFVIWELEYGDIIINIPGDDEDISKNLIVWYNDEQSTKLRDEERESDY